MSGSAIEWSPPSTIGIAPAPSTVPTVSSIAWCESFGSAGTTGASPKSAMRSSAKASIFASRCGPGGHRRRGSARGRTARRAVGDEVVHRRAEHDDVEPLELGRILGVRQPAEGQQARVVGLLAVRLPAFVGSSTRTLRRRSDARVLTGTVPVRTGREAASRRSYGKVGQVLGARRGDEDDVLEPAAAERRPVEAGLQRHDVAGDQRVVRGRSCRGSAPRAPRGRRRGRARGRSRRAGRRRAPSRAASGSRAPRRSGSGHVDVAADRARLNEREGERDRLLGQPLQLAQLRRGLADDEVRVISEKQPDSRSRGKRSSTTGSSARIAPGALVVADRSLRAVRDDEVIRDQAVIGEDPSDVGLDALAASAARRRGSSASAADLGAPEHVARGRHGLLGAALGAPDAGELGLVLRPAAVDEERRVGRQLDAVGAQVVGDLDREVRRHRGARHAGLAAGPQGDLDSACSRLRPGRAGRRSRSPRTRARRGRCRRAAASRATRPRRASSRCARRRRSRRRSNGTSCRIAGDVAVSPKIRTSGMSRGL